MTRLKTLFISAMALVLAQTAVAEWDVGTFTDDVVRASTADGVDSTDFYYPLVSDDERDAHADAFPIVVMLQGALVDKSLYSDFATKLAAKGYVVVVPNHLQRLNPFAPAQLFTSQWVVSDVWGDAIGRDNNPFSPLFQIIDTDNMGVSGHSFGGAAALFTTTGTCQPPFCFGPFYFLPPAVKAAAVFGTHTVQEQGPFAGTEPLDVDNLVPVTMINGSLDSIDEVEATFPLIEPEKALIVLEGVNHWGITNIQNPPSNSVDPAVQTKSQGWSTSKIAKYAALAYDAYLKGSKGAKKKLESERSERGVSVRFED